MKVPAQQLANALTKSNLSTVWIHGDETYFVDDAANVARSYFTQKQIDERFVFYPNEAGFDWQIIFEHAFTPSLFGEKKLIELHFTQTKFASDVLLELFKKPLSTVSFIIVSPKLDSKQQQSKWFTTLDQFLINVAIWPLTQSEFPSWLQQQLKQAALQLDKDAFQLLLQSIDGNALAAKQQIERLKLLSDNKPLSVTDLVDVVFDQSHFELFDLSDALLQNDIARFTHVLERLQQKEIATPLILWSMTRDIRALIAILEKKPVYEASKKRQQLLQQFAQKQRLDSLYRALQQSFNIDTIIKGVNVGDVWRQLLQLGLHLMQIKTVMDYIYG